MSPRTLIALLPVAILGTAVLYLLRNAEAPTPDPPAPVSNPVASRPSWALTDFTTAPAADALPGWDVRRGRYEMQTSNGHRALALLAEPMVEGKVLWTRAIRGAGGVRARMQGEPARRSTPRFCIGLHSDFEFQLRALPDRGELHLVMVDLTLANETLLASAPWTGWAWAADEWIWLELTITPEPGGAAAAFAGRIWPDGTPRPDAPLVQFRREQPPAPYYAALEGAPFALKPIFIDRAETWNGAE